LPDPDWAARLEFQAQEDTRSSVVISRCHLRNVAASVVSCTLMSKPLEAIMERGL